MKLKPNKHLISYSTHKDIAYKKAVSGHDTQKFFYKNGSGGRSGKSSTLLQFRCGLIKILLIIFVCSSSATSQAAKEVTGRVVGVTDGDSITLLDANQSQYKIRIEGIDAPEKKQAFGQKSKMTMSEMVFGKFVKVEWNKKDRYGRIVGKVLAPPSDCRETPCETHLDVGLMQLTKGMAWHGMAL